MLTVRLDPGLKERLDRAAGAARCSVSQVVINTLVRALDDRSAEFFGGPEQRNLGMLAARAAEWVRIWTGESWRESRYAHQALLACINTLLNHPMIAPSGAADPPAKLAEEIAVFERNKTTRELADRMRTPKRLGVSLAMGMISDMFGADRHDKRSTAPAFRASKSTAPDWSDDLRRAARVLKQKESSK
jgi:hypothetical protein